MHVSLKSLAGLLLSTPDTQEARNEITCFEAAWADTAPWVHYLIVR